MLAVSVFFLLGLLGYFISSVPFLNAVQRINEANSVLNNTSQAIELLNTSKSNLDEALGDNDYSHIRIAFLENQRILKEWVKIGIMKSVRFKPTSKNLKAAALSIRKYETASRKFLALLSKHPRIKNKEMIQKLTSELLIPNEFYSDAKEDLLKAQISIKNTSDLSFIDVYKARYKPLLVAGSLSLMFFLFVVTVGFSITKRLRKSLANLTNATDIVASGNLNYRASILRQDEIGNLTNAFNEMVLAIANSQDKLSRLHGITSDFSEALVPDQVFEIIISQGIDALQASGAIIGILNSETYQIEIKKHAGFSTELTDHLKTMSLELHAPMSNTIRYGEPIFIESPKEFKRLFPRIFTQENYYHRSIAVLPLAVASVKLGSLLFSFNVDRKFTMEEKDFMMALARQCAQALHRSQLFNDAKEAIQARDEFLSIASHELKTPLTPLKLQLQGLVRMAGRGDLATIEPKRLITMFETSNRQISRLATLIEDLLDVTRITSGKLTLHRETFNLSEMIEEVVSNYKIDLSKANCPVVIKLDKGIVGHLDKLRMEQVLINLLMNAAKYAPGKPVEIVLERPAENKGRLMVKDQGPGVAPENRERIFKCFERVRGRDNIGGLGLGLYISRQIAEAHGGKIYVESVMGEGSTFIMDFPLSEPALNA
jgi:signal transduction histidine kinase